MEKLAVKLLIVGTGITDYHFCLGNSDKLFFSCSWPLVNSQITMRKLLSMLAPDIFLFNRNISLHWYTVYFDLIMASRGNENNTFMHRSRQTTVHNCLIYPEISKSIRGDYSQSILSPELICANSIWNISVCINSAALITGQQRFGLTIMIVPLNLS